MQVEKGDYGVTMYGGKTLRITRQQLKDFRTVAGGAKTPFGVMSSGLIGLGNGGGSAEQEAEDPVEEEEGR